MASLQLSRQLMLGREDVKSEAADGGGRMDTEAWPYEIARQGALINYD